MAIVLEHLVEVVSDGFEHRPLCSCGWCGNWSEDDEAATVAGLAHRDEAVGPPDAVDVFLSGLLDLQDDIARLVIWVAENWAPDLPHPRWYASGSDDDDRAAIRVLVCCQDEAELARVAEVVGVTPVDDDTANSTGNRYRRAIRCFGRVELSAYRRIDDEGVSA